jgi:hypothetical protein
MLASGTQWGTVSLSNLRILNLRLFVAEAKLRGSVDGDSPKYEQPHNRSDRRILEQCLAAVVPAVMDLYS